MTEASTESIARADAQAESPPVSGKSRLCWILFLTAIAIVGAVSWEFLRPVEFVPVTGRVMFQGKPLTNGFVMSRPVRGGQTALGALDDEGRFTIETNGVPGAAVGLHRLAVKAYNREMPPRPIIPAEFLEFRTSPLTMTVSRRSPNDFEFDLSEARKK